MTEATSAPPVRTGLRRRVYFILDAAHAAGPLGLAYEAALIALIIANVFAVVLESVPSIRSQWQGAFDGFEAVSVVLFSLEYLARLWSAPEDPRFAGSTVLGRLRYALQPLMLVDFLAIAPSYIAFFVPFVDLRMLRLFRLLRLLKIARYSPALATFAHVIVSERRALIGTLLLLLCVMCFSAEAMYLAEGRVQPRLFGTIPDAMWWAITTLTTVGYGDAIPVTPLGKLIAGTTMILGLGLFALPVGIVATGFVNEIRRRDFIVTWQLVAAIGRLRQGIQSLNREGRERFLAAFEQVSTHFQQLFTKLFGGGKAELRLTESEDPDRKSTRLNSSH